MGTYKPIRIYGKWKMGYALDVHTTESIPLGEDEYGHMQFETTRSDVGELLYQLKYRGQSREDELAAVAAKFLREVWKPEIDLIVPVPPSTERFEQPVLLIADALARKMNVPTADCVELTRDPHELKNISDPTKRADLLDGLYRVKPGNVTGRRVLLLDDLYRSGATMNAAAVVLKNQGKAQEIYALTMTKTRSNR